MKFHSFKNFKYEIEYNLIKIGGVFMDDKKKSFFQKFNELTAIKKASVCLGAIIILCILAFIAVSSFSVTEDYTSQEIIELSAEYPSYDLYVERFNAWANSLYNNDSEPTSIADALRDDARDVIIDMHDGGMSDEEIRHALNEPSRLAYDKGIVDSPSLYDESFVKEVLNGG